MEIHIKNKYWRVLNAAKIVAFLVVLILAGLSLLTMLPLRTPIKPFIVLTGSMNPTIPTGSIAFVERGFEGLKIGDIVTFKRPDKPVDNVTHRIVKEENVDGKTVYITRGDANNSDDLWKVRKEAIWGKALFNVPLLGYVISFSKTKPGVILLIVLPLIIIALDEMRVIYKEIKKRRKKKDEPTVEKIEKEVKKRYKFPFIHFLIGILITCNFFVFIPRTYASFSDQTQITNNQVSTSWWVIPSVAINTPNGGETLYQGNSYNITWTATSSDPFATTNIDIYYSTDGGITYPNTIVLGEANDGTYSWIAPAISSSTVKVKVVVTDSHGLINSDESNNNLTIKLPIVLNEFLPNPVGADNAAMPNGEWVELYNNGTASVDVNNWVLYDVNDTHDLVVNAGNTNTGGTIVAPSGFLVVYRNGDGGFELNNIGGDTVRLYNNTIGSGGVLIDSYAYTTDATIGKSYARSPDGTGAWVDPDPTPGGPNVLTENYQLNLTVNEITESMNSATESAVINNENETETQNNENPQPSLVPQVEATPSSEQQTPTPTLEPSPTPMPELVPAEIPIISPVIEQPTEPTPTPTPS